MRVQLTTVIRYLFAQKHSILDGLRGSDTPAFRLHLIMFLCHHNKYLMGYFEFLHGSRLICLPLNILEKLHRQYLFEKPEEAEAYHLYLS